MNWDRVKGNWKQMAGSVRSRWGRLTGDDLEAIDGERERFIGKLQERYGMAKDEAQRELDAWLKSSPPLSGPHPRRP